MVVPTAKPLSASADAMRPPVPQDFRRAGGYPPLMFDVLLELDDAIAELGLDRTPFSLNPAIRPMHDNDVLLGLIVVPHLDSKPFLVAREEPNHAVPFHELRVANG
jgi:hypothetical protein